MSLNTLLDDFNAKLDRYGDGVWRTEPVHISEFMCSREHLGLGPLYPRQQAAISRLLGDDPLSIFEEPGDATSREFQLAVLLWGKGSGKDYVCSCLVAYLVYVLLCLVDPQRYFEFAPGEPIDIVNVAYNADQARRVFFEKLRQRILGWQWLSANFNLIERGRARNKHIPGRETVHINDQEVLFPRQIRCFSRHSENESYEGYNIVAWIMDEASAFLSKAKRENADLIYQTLRTSAASRFGLRWVGAIISYPRHGDDFTMTKLREAERDPQLGILPDGPAATWEINERVGTGEFLEVRAGHMVPAELYNDYILDFEEALARYECQPPAARDAFFRFPDRLEAAVRIGRKPLVEWEPVVSRRRVSGPEGEEAVREYAAIKVTRLGSLPKGTKVFAHGDPGLVNDSFALCLAHGVPATIEVKLPAGEVMDSVDLEARRLAPTDVIDWERDVVRTVVDAVIVWQPDPRHGRQVDLQNVEDTLMLLRDRYGIGFKASEPTLTFDHWNSAHIIQRCQQRKMNVDDEMWSRAFQVDIYRNARSCFYNDLVTLPDTPAITGTDPLGPGALYELKRIEFVDGQKIDHPEGGSKDIADAVVRAIQHVTGSKQYGMSFGTAFGTSERYRHAAMIPSYEPKVDPDHPPGIPKKLKEFESERRQERPLGELLPSEGTVDGRKLAFGSINGKKP
jgi:hypothetical protein